MSNELVPQNAEVGSSESSVDMPEEFSGGESYIKFKMDKDRNLLINDMTGEENAELLVRICAIEPERVLFEEGELVCASKGKTKYSKDGVLCATCPNINNKPFIFDEEQKARYIAACKENNIENPPEWNPKSRCTLRMIVRWIEQFEKNEDGSYLWIRQPGLCYLSCPPASAADMAYEKTGYAAKMKSIGYRNLNNVVTKISIGQRRNEKLQSNYSYEIFKMEGTYDAITKKCVNYNEMIKEMGGTVQIASQQTPVPQLAKKVEQEAVQPELLQPVSKKPPAIVKHDEKYPKPVKAPVVTPEPAITALPQVPIQPAQSIASLTELKLKIKYAYATLPADVQGIVLSVLKIDTIDKITDNDLKVAYETIEMAKSEVSERAVDAKPAETPTVAPAPAMKPKTPW